MVLRQAEAGTPVVEICEKLEISEQTYYRWEKKFGGLGIPELVSCASSGERTRS